MWAKTICCFTMLLIQVIATQTNTSMLVFNPTELKQIPDGTQHMVIWSTNLTGVASINITVQDENVMNITTVGDVKKDKANGTFYGQFNVSTLIIGYSNITVRLYDFEDTMLTEVILQGSVILSYQNLNEIFIQMITALVTISYVNMGASIEISIIKNILKRPTGPLIGLICQFIFMPLISFAFGKLAFPDNPIAQLGMFLSGCSPGGGISNMWTHLLDGSLDLSVVMTLISSTFAFGTLPLWVYLMAPFIMENTNFIIPYYDIFIILVLLAVPCLIGMIIKIFLPRFAHFLKNMFTALSIFNIIFIFSFGTYANRYVFSFLTFKTLLIGFLYPCVGYASGMLLAKLCCQPIKDVIAIGVETGIQNNTVAYIILKLSFEIPAADLAVVFPLAIIMMNAIPLLLMFIMKKTYNRFARFKSHNIREFENTENGWIIDDKETSVNQTASQKKLRFSEGSVDNPTLDLKDEAVDKHLSGYRNSSEVR